jgi:DNA-binding transcriptional MerR regulator
MPEDNIAKVYYTIGEVADMFSVNTSLIRFWEKEFDIIRPMKNKKGNRLFTQKDVDNFHLIFNLVKERGYTLRGAREKLKKNPDETWREYEIIKSLNKIELFLRDIKKNLERTPLHDSSN